MKYRIANSYLSGSYLRKTAIRPLDDVDVIFEIDPSFWSRNAYEKLFDLLPTPESIIDTFAGAIRYRYGGGVRRQRCSVGLDLGHLRIDVVPAVPDPDDESSNRLWIPDRRRGQWIETAPRLHTKIATEINKSSDGRFIPLVRLLKAWNAGLPSTARLKSFAIETMAARVFANIDLVSLTEGAFSFFDFVTWLADEGATQDWDDCYQVRLLGWRGPSLPDTAGTDSNLLAGEENERMKKFGRAARVVRDAFLDASRARTPQRAWKYLDGRFMAGMSRL